MRGSEQLRAFRHRVRSTRIGRLARRVAVGFIGAVVVIIGLFLIPLPGPGWLIVLAGLAILAIEFAWARRLLTFTRARLERWWRWLGRQHWTVRVITGLLGFAFVFAVTALSLLYGLGLRSLRDFLD
jgi:uncharacterized protein (TIGR02611 family)